MSKHTPCPVSPTGKHKWEQVFTADCRFEWQFQMVCACGVLKDSRIFGIPPTPKAAKEAIRTEPVDEPKEGSLFSPGSAPDIARLIETLFDHNLDWAATVRTLRPDASPEQVFSLAEEWSALSSVTEAITKYTKSLLNQEQRAALLLHHAQKLSVDDAQTGAVRATCLNILKSAHIVEKSEQSQNGVMRIEGLEKGIRRMLGEDYIDSVAPDASKSVN